MASVEDRVISMSFENTKFQTGVTQTLSSIEKLNASLKGLGATSGLDNLEKASSKISFTGLSSAIDKIKAKFGHGIPEAADAFGNIEKSADKVAFTGLTSAVDKVKGQFHFEEAASGFSGIEKAADHVSFGGLTRGADQAFASVEKSSGKVSFQGLTDALSNVTSHFSLVEGAAAVAFGNIATRASLAAGQTVKQFFNPIKSGFEEYQTNLNSIQTILANTQDSGGNLKSVNAALNELNTYSDKTIYNFSEMAKNIGTFTAAGVQLEPATAAIKGIANLAALSGSNSQQASTAMYQLSQAIASGRVSLQDWNSVVNAGMGGAVFQKSLMRTAENMGTLKDGAVKLDKATGKATVNGMSFRESITAKPGEKSWLTSDVLTKTLAQFTGDMSAADLAAQGFNKSQIKAIMSQAKMAQESATKVKTLTALLDTTKEQIGSGWSKTWQIVFGDFKEAPKLFTGISDAIGDFVGKSADARNKLLADWKHLGGRTALIESIKNVFVALGSVLKPIKEAFRDIFPATTGKQLADLTKKIEAFTDKLKIGPETAEKLKRTFAGLFAVLDIGKQILGGIFTALGHMFSAAGEGSGGILGLTGSVGDLLVRLDEWLKKGDKIKTVFSVLGDALAIPIHLIGTLTGKLNGLFSGGGNAAGGAAKSVGNLGASLAPAQKAAEGAKAAFSALLGVAHKVAAVVSPLIKGVGDAFSQIGGAIADGIKNADFNKVFAVLNTALIGGVFLTLRKAITGKKSIFGDLNASLFGGGAMKQVTASLSTLQGSLQSIQKNIQAHTLLLIATAVGVLTASTVALSLVSPQKLAASMTAITVGMAQLMVTMNLLGKGAGAGFAKMPIIAGSLILLATAIDTLSIAVLMLSTLSWEELGKGLTGVAGLLAIVSVAAQALQKTGPGLILAGAGMSALGIGLTIMAVPMKIFATMKWEEMGKGLAGVAGALIVVGVAAQALPLNLPITAAGLILMGIGLSAVAGSVRIFATMDWKTLGKGLAGIAAALVIIGGAMQLMPPTLPLTAAGLILVGIGLTGVAGAIALMGHMNVATLAKGIIALGATLAVLAVGMTAMIASLPGAAALLVISAALAVFVPVLGILGQMSWATIAKGLAAIAASFVVIGISGALAGPAFVILGAGMALLGAGIAALGGGVFLLAKGLSLLGSDGAKGVAVLTAALAALIASIPMMIINFIKGLVEIQTQLAALAPKVVASMVTVLGMLLTAIIQSAPKFADAAITLITAMIKILDTKGSDVIAAGYELLIKLLQGISQHIGQVTATVANIVTNFLNALAGKLPSIVAAGINILAGLLKGIASGLGRVATAAGDILARFVESIGNGATRVVTAGTNSMIKFVTGLAGKMSDVAAKGAEAIIKFVGGVGEKAGNVATAGAEAMGKFVAAVAKAATKLGNEGAKAILALLHGIRDNVAKYEADYIAAGIEIGAAIVAGIPIGIARGAKAVFDKAADVAKGAVNSALHAIHAKSPSRDFMQVGQYMMDGLAVGIGANGQNALNVSASMANSVISMFRSVFQIKSPSQVMYDIGQQVGKGFHDGLLGSQDDINNAFADLQTKITEEMHTAVTEIGQHHARLKELRGAHKKDWDAIHAEDKALNQERALLTALHKANDEVIKGVSAQKNQLLGLAAQFDEVTQRMQNAQSALDQFKTQYATLPDIPTLDSEGNALDPATQLAQYTSQVQAQADAVFNYHNVLDQLRKLGLDDQTYQKLVQEGPADMAFAKQLAEGGKAAVDNLNALDKGLVAQANSISESAATALYGVGISATQGLIKGFEDSRNELRKQMEKIATEMIKAIRKKLKVKSPSKEFAEIGKFSNLGLVQGLTSSSKMVHDAASMIGDDTLSAMRDSISRMSEVLNDEVDMNPTITPVLDLTHIQAGAKQIADLTSSIPLSAASSYGLAASVIAEQAAASNSENTPGDSPGPSFQFIQNNTSPESLREAEIYRQTHNQLSQAKDVLGL